jgi:hypothetical protein
MNRMVSKPRKLTLYLIMAAVIIAIMLVASFQFGAIQANERTTGTLTVSIKDAPVDLSKLEVTIDSIETQSNDNGWINIPFIDGVQSVRFDLLSLQDVFQELSTTQIPAGNYTKIRLHIRDATATYKDGTTDNLNVPSDKIDVIIHFEVKEKLTTNILIDMTSDFVAISNSHNLRPVLKATIVPPTIPTPIPSPTTPTPNPSFT